MGGKSSGSLGAGMIAGKTPWQRQMTVERLWHTRLSTDLPPLLSIYGDDRHAGLCALLWRHLTNKINAPPALRRRNGAYRLGWAGKVSSVVSAPKRTSFNCESCQFSEGSVVFGMSAGVARKTATKITRQR
jgi:hypothetical protein